ncbi:MAG TPA: efflux RND transporter periplasmic adaptor subunit [Candidatus Binataceae bacterium]|nr:efflux RND transporter periplasmic adaptor subunit [Candidatus Binataceae bacterium]
MNYNSSQWRLCTGFLALGFLLLLAPPIAHGAGSQLAPIQITPERRQLIGLEFATVVRKDVSDRLETTGNIEADERLQGYVQTRFAGWIEQVFANSTYQYVRRGQPLFTIYSPDLVSTENEYLLAIDARKRVSNSAIADVTTDASSLVESAAERLKLWGVSPREIARLERERTVRHAVEIDSPMSGYIVERNALPNMYVQPDTRLFTITDLSKVWIYAAVFQDEIGKVRPGDPATVTLDAYPGTNFDGRVDFIQPQIDPLTRTGRVRCEFYNPKGQLLPGMFAHVALDLPMGTHTVIPDTAVLRTGTHNVAFIDRGEGYLTPAEVELGPHVGDQFIVLKGLAPGQQVVSSANFLIDSESQLQAAAGAFVPPPPGVGANAVGQAVAAMPEASLEFTSDPNPMVRGHNKVSVTLRDSKGALIPGAQVTISFFMAAMPAMGMAAMHAQSAAQDQGNGAYAANIDLPSGGTWSLTITASKGGSTIAAKQMDVSAGGSMAM